MIDDQTAAEQLAAAQACVDETADAATDALAATFAAIEAFNQVHDRWHAAYLAEPANKHLNPVASLANMTINAVTAERLDPARIVAGLVDAALDTDD
jgi:hypothetical protein